MKGFFVTRKANLFQFDCRFASISFAITNLRGGSLLAYRDDRLSVTSTEVCTEVCSFGELVSATIELIPKSYKRVLTIVIPEIAMNGSEAISISTIAVIARHDLDSSGRAATGGQLVTYESLFLPGRASLSPAPSLQKAFT